MNFLILEELYNNWKEILVIGRTIKHDDKRYHIIGMTLSEKNQAKIYIIEPYKEIAEIAYNQRRSCNQRKRLKQREKNEFSYLHCKEFKIGDTLLCVQGGTGGCLKYISEYSGEMQLFFDMLKAGWQIPEWLKEEEWENLQLISLEIADIQTLPNYSKEIPITIKHSLTFVEHIVEKTVTLSIGKKRNFSFINETGEEVKCYINNVTLIDMWKDMEEKFNNPEYKKLLSAERLEEMKKMSYEALQHNCPKGMCYIGIEYECSKEIGLQFYSKQYLKSYPQQSEGSAVVMGMRLKPDKQTGIYNLPLKGFVIQTAVPKDTVKILAEVFSYFEKIEEWEETI